MDSNLPVLETLAALNHVLQSFDPQRVGIKCGCLGFSGNLQQLRQRTAMQQCTPGPDLFSPGAGSSKADDSLGLIRNRHQIPRLLAGRRWSAGVFLQPTG